MLTDDTAKKAARAAYMKAYREANRERLLASEAAYREANREAIRAKIKAHYESNAEVYKAKAKQWAENNPDRRAAISKKYKQENPDVYRAASKRAHKKYRDQRVEVSRKYRENNPQKMRTLMSAWRKKFPEVNAHHVGLRRTRKILATPLWASLDAVKQIYKRCRELTKETGVRHHVDHEIPLKHPLVCGLHNEFNLRVITAAENHRKKNKFVV